LADDLAVLLFATALRFSVASAALGFFLLFAARLLPDFRVLFRLETALAVDFFVTALLAFVRFGTFLATGPSFPLLAGRDQPHRPFYCLIKVARSKTPTRPAKSLIGECAIG